MFSWTSNHARQQRKLIWSTVYATGCPLIITSITAVLQFMDLDDNLKPDFGKSKCFFDEGKQLSAFVLFYFPLLLLQVTSTSRLLFSIDNL
jgi:hypothetical protein